jgi:DNA invertase Pin-like site-specific DNA recombinase
MANFRESPLTADLRADTIYCRVSSPGQKNTTSLPEQERLCREHAREQGWPISGTWVFREVEGGEDLYRPQMDRLWDAIQAGQVRRVLIDVLDRLSRDEGDQGAFYHHCDKYGCDVVLVSEDLDESEHGRNLRTLSGIMARMERSEIRRRTQRGRRARVTSGKIFTAAFPLYGYVWADPAKGERTRYVADPETAPIVQRIFRDAADGVPLHVLARSLVAEGVPTPAQLWASRGQWPEGRPYSPVWRRSTLVRLIHHPAFTGQHVAYRFEHRKMKVRDNGVTRKVSTIRERADDDPARVPLPGACPALVSRELANMARARLVENRRENSCRIVRPDLAILRAGIARCAYCGDPVTVQVDKERMPGTDVATRRYRCCVQLERISESNPATCPGHGCRTMATHKLDAAVWRDVLAWLSDERNVRDLLADWRAQGEQATESAASRIAATDAVMKSLRTKMTNLALAVAETADPDSRHVLQSRLDEYAAQLRIETAKRERLQGEAAAADAHAAQLATLTDWTREVTRRAGSFTWEEQRQALKALGVQVDVWRPRDEAHAGAYAQQRYRVRLFAATDGERDTIILPAFVRVNSSAPDTTNL